MESEPNVKKSLAFCSLLYYGSFLLFAEIWSEIRMLNFPVNFGIGFDLSTGGPKFQTDANIDECSFKPRQTRINRL